MIAACDTFRSGAVEQLKTHCARLGVPLYERGYEKDPANVAREAQRAAARASTDVLLVDTAGVRLALLEPRSPPVKGRGRGAARRRARARRRPEC
jgi:signal recognition particle GTPase